MWNSLEQWYYPFCVPGSTKFLGARPALAHIAEEGVWDVHAGDQDDCEDHPFATHVSHAAGSVPAHSWTCGWIVSLDITFEGTIWQYNQSGCSQLFLLESKSPSWGTRLWLRSGIRRCWQGCACGRNALSKWCWYIHLIPHVAQTSGGCI